MYVYDDIEKLILSLFFLVKVMEKKELSTSTGCGMQFSPDSINYNTINAKNVQLKFCTKIQHDLLT